MITGSGRAPIIDVSTVSRPVISAAADSPQSACGNTAKGDPPNAIRPPVAAGRGSVSSIPAPGISTSVEHGTSLWGRFVILSLGSLGTPALRRAIDYRRDSRG